MYRNNGDGSFTNISAEAGIKKEGFGLGIAVLDVNKDGFSDLYVGNDYITNDLFYLNENGEQFRDEIDELIKHQSRFSMGNDAADINNDGYMDIITLDMLPESNLRKKTVISGNGYIVYINDNRFGYTHQYVRNMLQLNNGDMSFSEIGQLAGVHQTEWSWAPLFADFDNDGHKDLLITNGFPKDITDNDFISFRKQAGAFVSQEDLLAQVPSVKIPNYAFQNKGDLTFEDVSSSWGFSQASFSNGAAFVDLDNDGDLDYVVNNINDLAFIYQNTSNEQDEDKKRHYLRIKLIGPETNAMALGAKVSIKYGEDQYQYHEQNIYRGYVSSVEAIIHFGLGDELEVKELQIVWPDGKVSEQRNISADQVLEVKYSEAKASALDEKQDRQALLKEISSSMELEYVHQERDYIDYNIQRNIPHKFSQAGPSIAVGDVNGDELEDFFLGGSREFSGTFFLQDAQEKFREQPLLEAENKEEEDIGSLLFDADSDGDLDLYLVSGSFEYPEGSPQMQDRLYINDGQANFELNPDALPELRASGSCVRAADVDADGDLDLFVGGRVVVGAYPQAPKSYILENEGGKFKEITATISPGLEGLGMVTDAIWTDFNNDGAIDLIVVGEFLPLSFFANQAGQLRRLEKTGVETLKGWWNSIVAGDFDKDGDMDYVAGNLGENNFYCATPEQPVCITAKDFDKNGSLDVVLSCYLKAEDRSMKAFPVHSWPELIAQSPIFRARFQKYEEYGRTTIDSLFPEGELVDALIMEANHMSSSYIENLGNGKFSINPLPLQAQFAPVNGMLVKDLNGDSELDILMLGNDYGNEVNMGQYDAFTGLCLIGKGNGDFEVLTSGQSGFQVKEDAKALVSLMGASGREYIIASQNRGPLRLFELQYTDTHFLTLGQFDTSAKLYFKDGGIQKMEFPLGAGYLSQSGRIVHLDKEVQKIEISDYSGNTRTIEFKEES
ncbi:MAG: VCBS repeat-containing protein [Bacteroidota bacterium]